MKLSALWSRWLCGERDQFIEDWTAARAAKAHRETLLMLGRGDTVYTWSAKLWALKSRPNLRRFEARKARDRQGAAGAAHE